MEKLILETKEEGIVRLTINRPEARNALSEATAIELARLLCVYGEDPDARVIVVAGAGDKAFCAGADLKERKVMSPAERWHQTQQLQKAMLTAEEIPVPVVAAISGFCMGGGLELALACDIRIASESAVFSFPEMTLGAFPGSHGPVRLARMISPSVAKELLMTARRMKADEALRVGLIHRMIPDGAMEDAILALCGEIKSSTRRGVAAVKKLVNLVPELSSASAIALSDAMREPMDGTSDYDEGIRAHFEHRQAKWE